MAGDNFAGRSGTSNFDAIEKNYMGAIFSHCPCGSFIRICGYSREWGINPNRVGFMGFSAGAMVTTGTLLQEDPAARPNFAAPIYGGPFGAMPEIPADLPPVFLAWAQDDFIAGPPAMRFYDALKAAGYKPEVHIFSGGGHGFGMLKNGKSSDHWIEIFYDWLDAEGFTKPLTR